MPNISIKAPSVKDSKQLSTALPGNGPPLVSIITPFLNAGKFLQEAVESVLAQSYDHWELLLVDDGSSDQSPRIARHYAARHPAKLRLLEHDGRAHLGASAALNLGIRRARGRYITFLDADDIYLPRTLERQVAVLEALPQAGAVYGPYQFWYSWSGEQRDVLRDFIHRPGVRPGTLHRPPHLLVHSLQTDWRSKPGTSSIMVRRETLASVGAFEPETFGGIGQDKVFWARLSLKATVFVTDECLFRYRQHPDSSCTVAVNDGRVAAFWSSFLGWLEEYLSDEGVEDPDVWRAVRICRRDFERSVRFAALRRLFRRYSSLKTRMWLTRSWMSSRSTVMLALKRALQAGNHPNSDPGENFYQHTFQKHDARLHPDVDAGRAVELTGTDPDTA